MALNHGKHLICLELRIMDTKTCLGKVKNSEILAKKSYSFIVKKSEEIGKKKQKKTAMGIEQKKTSFLLKC